MTPPSPASNPSPYHPNLFADTSPSSPPSPALLPASSCTTSSPFPSTSAAAVDHDSLTPDQRAAVDHASGPLAVLAGPGSGKTRVMVHRVARLLRDGAPPESILALTFTVKAAQQLRDRLAELVGSSLAERIRARTFHAFGNSILRRFADTLPPPVSSSSSFSDPPHPAAHRAAARRNQSEMGSHDSGREGGWGGWGAEDGWVGGVGVGGGVGGGVGEGMGGGEGVLMDRALRLRIMRSAIRSLPQPPPTWLVASGIEGLAEDALAAAADLAHLHRAPIHLERWAAARLQALDAEPPADETFSLAQRMRLERLIWMARCVASFDARRLPAVYAPAVPVRSAAGRGGRSIAAPASRPPSDEPPMLTHEDSLSLALRILESSPFALAILRDENRHVVVDEFQDSNLPQLLLLRALCPPAAAPDLCVVGDDDQSIYAFRGADDRAFRRFADIWTDQRTIALAENFRSTPAIVRVANAVITEPSYAPRRFAPEKECRAAPPAPPPPRP